MLSVTEIFGTMVFNDHVMKERLPEAAYEAMQKTIRDGRRLDPSLASVVANAMKDWAIEKGATHFTHWFQPMTGMTAEKHDSFISPTSDGHVIMEFSGKELVRGESDASSFPSGGLRATFEARGYTAWDPTSYVFIKDDTLCIPTAFCSYGGEALDKKTPLLRSMEAINRQTMRVLRLFGNEDVTSTKTTVGAEQEYFLIDKTMYDRRPDLVYTGRTLFGAGASKGQELGDHYFGTIKPRVADFMRELDIELWKLGVLSKTEHNEAAPAQHELAPVFTTTNIATDHNQLMMEMMQKIAKRHGLVCLLHEKPFAGVNGSGKHDNWSITTSTGANLFEPGDTPHENAQFLLFLVAVIRAADEYQELLRASVATAANDHRLGASEAPPAVVSMFLGDELEGILDAIAEDRPYDAKEKDVMKVGVHVIPKFQRDTTDRNRTSPLAFTGNKFEFRMPGASMSIAGPNIILNTAVAESLRVFADELEGAEDFNAALHDLIKREYSAHRRIIFNGNGYDDAWRIEASRRGLANLASTPDALPAYKAEKSVTLFETHRVFSRSELEARYEILTENYCNTMSIETATMIEMLNRSIMPAISAYCAKICDAAAKKEAFGLPVRYESSVMAALSDSLDSLSLHTASLESALASAKSVPDKTVKARIFLDRVIPEMNECRRLADGCEAMIPEGDWCYPSYGRIINMTD